MKFSDLNAIAGTEETKLVVILGHYLDTMVKSGGDRANLVIEEPSN